MFRVSIVCILVLILLLQFFLSKRTSGFWGLILPLLNVIVATGYCLPGIVASFQKDFSLPMLSLALLNWMAYNVTTIIFWGIYQYERKKRR